MMGILIHNVKPIWATKMVGFSIFKRRFANKIICSELNETLSGRTRVVMEDHHLDVPLEISTVNG